jgi:hypothetical protein
MSFFDSLVSSVKSKFSSNRTAEDEKLSRFVIGIANDMQLTLRARDEGLAIQTISWEDSARYKGSCWGPNISDMTLRLAGEKNNYNSCLPMIRYANFNDRTADLPIDSFKVTVGNESSGASLKRIPLKEYLQNIGEYVKTSSGASCPSMYCEEKDKNVLTSAQFCVLPLAEGTTEFNVSLYNYQSIASDPAVLVLVCSQKGTSAQAVFSGTTELYFNTAGDAANYVAERLKDERKRLGKDVDAKMDADEQERNCLFIVQIPLEQKPRARTLGYGLESMSYNQEQCFGSELLQCYSEPILTEISADLECQSATFTLKSATTRKAKGRGMDRAVISVGKTHSKFEGIKNHTLKRDTRFPIRLTFQFYLTTDEQDVPEPLWKEMKQNIDGVYSKSTAVGSLVTQLDTGRTTEWDASGEHKASEFNKTLPPNTSSVNPMFSFSP